MEHFKPLGHYIKGSTYKHTYQKFHTFVLKDFHRVTVMDADGFAISELDHLFFLNLTSKIPIAAPQGYWFGGEGLMAERSQQHCLGRYIFRTGRKYIEYN